MPTNLSSSIQNPVLEAINQLITLTCNKSLADVFSSDAFRNPSSVNYLISINNAKSTQLHAERFQTLVTNLARSWFQNDSC